MKFRGLVQILVFVVFGAGGGDGEVESSLGQLVEPHSLVNGSRTGELSTFFGSHGPGGGLSAKLPAGVDEGVHCFWSFEDEDVAEFGDAEAQSSLQFDHFHIGLLAGAIVDHNAFSITRTGKQDLDAQVAEDAVSGSMLDRCPGERLRLVELLKTLLRDLLNVCLLLCLAGSLHVHGCKCEGGEDDQRKSSLAHISSEKVSVYRGGVGE